MDHLYTATLPAFPAKGIKGGNTAGVSWGDLQCRVLERIRVATSQPSESSESPEPSDSPESFHPFGPSGPAVPAVPPEIVPAEIAAQRGATPMPEPEPTTAARADEPDTPTEQFEPNFDDTDPDGFRLMDRFTCVPDTEEPPAAAAAGDGRRRRKLAAVAALTLAAVTAGVLVGYGVVQALGGWNATWIGPDRPAGANPSPETSPTQVEQGTAPSSTSPSPSESASPAGTPISGPSRSAPAGGSSPRPDPSPTWTSAKPTPSATPSQPPPDPQPSKTKRPGED